MCFLRRENGRILLDKSKGLESGRRYLSISNHKVFCLEDGNAFLYLLSKIPQCELFLKKLKLGFQFSNGSKFSFQVFSNGSKFFFQVFSNGSKFFFQIRQVFNYRLFNATDNVRQKVQEKENEF